MKKEQPYITVPLSELVVAITEAAYENWDKSNQYSWKKWEKHNRTRRARSHRQLALAGRLARGEAKPTRHQISYYLSPMHRIDTDSYPFEGTDIPL